MMPNNLRKLLSMRAGSRGPVWLGHKPAFFTGGAVDKSHERFWPGRHRKRPPWCTSERKGQTAGAVRMMTLVDLLRRRGLSNFSEFDFRSTDGGLIHRLQLCQRPVRPAGLYTAAPSRVAVSTIGRERRLAPAASTWRERWGRPALACGPLAAPKNGLFLTASEDLWVNGTAITAVDNETARLTLI
jgi:hypothetical protein